MKNRFASITAALATTALAACGGKVFIDLPTTTSSAGGAGGAGGAGQSSVVVGPGPGPSVSASIATASSSSGPIDCSSSPDCNQCCMDSFPDGYEALIKNFFFECGCAANAPCSMECSQPGGCQDPTAPDVGCSDCLNDVGQQNEPCVQKTLQECQAFSSCAEVLQCFDQC